MGLASKSCELHSGSLHACCPCPRLCFTLMCVCASDVSNNFLLGPIAKSMLASKSTSGYAMCGCAVVLSCCVPARARSADLLSLLCCPTMRGVAAAVWLAACCRSFVLPDTSEWIAPLAVTMAASAAAWPFRSAVHADSACCA
jgi:hypothetical protein